MAAYVIGRHAYAFSPRLKSWDVVKLAAGHAEYPSIGPGYATVEAPGHIYTFSNQTGKWDDIDVEKVFGTEDQ